MRVTDYACDACARGAGGYRLPPSAGPVCCALVSGPSFGCRQPEPGPSASGSVLSLSRRRIRDRRVYVLGEKCNLRLISTLDTCRYGRALKFSSACASFDTINIIDWKRRRANGECFRKKNAVVKKYLLPPSIFHSIVLHVKKLIELPSLSTRFTTIGTRRNKFQVPYRKPFSTYYL